MRKLRTFTALIILSVLVCGCTATVTPKTRDVPGPGEKLELMQVQFGDARAYADLIHEVFGILATCDIPTQTVILKGPPDVVLMAISLMDKLETAGCVDDCRSSILFMKRLKVAKARDAVDLLESMIRKGVFPSRLHEMDPPVAVFCYEPENAVWVCTTRVWEDRVRNILDEIDRPPGTQPQVDIRIQHSGSSPDNP